MKEKPYLKNLNSQGEIVKIALKNSSQILVEVIASLKKGLMKKDTSTSTEVVLQAQNN